MKIINICSALQAYVNTEKKTLKKIGFAPTMGALHAGHLSLYNKAKEENDVIISSIFVNPTQFNNPEDLGKYPRTIEKDISKLENSGVVNAVYIPSVKEMYPEGTQSQSYHFDGIDQEMEGAFRPGHFDGVATIVETLFLHVQPDKAYFGEKDFQQLAIIKKMVEKKQLPIEIIGVPTMREKNGLAMSSRNQRLTENERENAAIIFQTLKNVNDWFRVLSVSEINKRVKEIFEKQELMTLEYFKIADEETLRETDFFYPNKKFRAFIVVFVGEVRLIDNMPLN